MPFVEEDGRGGSRFWVKVQAGAKGNEIVGLHGQAVKVRVKAPPAGGAANRELLRFLAGLLAVAPSRLRLVRGGPSPLKHLEVLGIAPEEVRDRLGL